MTSQTTCTTQQETVGAGTENNDATTPERPVKVKPASYAQPEKRNPWSPVRHTQRKKPPYLEMQTMTLDLVLDLCLYIRDGDTVMTPYGIGTLTGHRADESMEISLAFGGTLFVKRPESIHKVLSAEDYKQAMEHLDQVRSFHLASMCDDLKREVPREGICSACAFDRPEYDKDNRRKKNRWRLAKGGSAAPRKATHECDVCGQCVCAQHKLSGGVDYFTLCVDCSHDLNQTEHQINPHHPELEKNLHRLLHYYTRMSIRLSFVCPHLEKVAHRLTNEQRRDSQIMLGTSGLGFVGAALGVAGAAAILTPAGPAILLAAVATSATSGTLQGAHMSYNKFLSNKDAHQIADRVLGWHGLCLGILQTLEQLREDLLAESMAQGDREFGKMKAASLSRQSVDILNSLAVGSFSTTRHAMSGVGVSSALGASYSQAVSTGLQAIPVVGAAFSVGCMAMDATNIYGSLQTLRKPSEKAVALQHVKHIFVHSLPNIGYVQSTVQVIQDAVEVVNQRYDEQRKEQEQELEGQPQNAFQVVDSLFAEEEDDVRSID